MRRHILPVIAAPLILAGCSGSSTPAAAPGDTSTGSPASCSGFWSQTGSTAHVLVEEEGPAVLSGVVASAADGTSVGSLTNGPVIPAGHGGTTATFPITGKAATVQATVLVDQQTVQCDLVQGQVP